MNPSATYYEGQRSTVDPFYIKGDVFQRDQRYYDQQIGRRTRTPNKVNLNDGINNNYNSYGPGQIPSNISGYPQP